MKLIINMRLQSLDHRDSVEISNFSDLLLRIGEGAEPENESNMIHLDAKYVVRGENIANLVGNIYTDINEKYSDLTNQRVCDEPTPRRSTCVVEGGFSRSKSSCFIFNRIFIFNNTNQSAPAPPLP